ncbi:MAG: Ig-like domain-containing protein, partial [Vicinamibacterales bacterium]
IFGVGDTRIGSAGDVPAPLAAGASVSVGPSTVTIPANTAAGKYFLFIVADDGSQSITGEVNELNENNNASPAAVVSVTVANAPPIASDQSVATNEDTATPITLSASDTNNDALNFSIVDSPSRGTLSGTAPNLTYTPAADYNGADSFTFKAHDGTVDSNVATVAITVNAVNDAPVASGVAVSTDEDTSVAIALAATDVEGSTLTYNWSSPSHGTLTGSGPNLTYNPGTNYNGPDSFTFSVSDGAASSNVATVSITVAPINDAPIASSQSVSTNEDTALQIALGAIDADSAPLALSVVAGPSHGTISGTTPNVIYTPTANYFGADSFTFKANDGSLDSNIATVSITVNAVNDAPVANNQNKTVVENIATAITLTAGDVDSLVLTYSIVAQPTHGTLSGTAPNVTYTPAMNYEGPDSFTFRASDGSSISNTATVSTTVTPGINQYGFNGLLSPYQAPPKFGNLGSAQPMAWQYTLGGVVVNTSTEMPKVTFTKMNATNNSCTIPAGEPVQPVLNSTYFVNSASPGNSSFQYNTTTNTWQFNWQTAPPVTAGCWNVRVILERTGQVNGPFPLRLR